MNWKEVMLGRPIGGKVAYPCTEGLSNLFNYVCTIINQIPESQNKQTKIAWKKHVLTDCGKHEGIYDRSNGEVAFKASAFTIYCRDWEMYRPPLFTSDGYYSVHNSNKALYTVNVGDLILFGEIEDAAPTDIAGFNALRDKYKNNGGIVTACEAYINFKPDGTPWSTNHIEIIKG